jgi:hypothetical protein
MLGVIRIDEAGGLTMHQLGEVSMKEGVAKSWSSYLQVFPSQFPLKSQYKFIPMKQPMVAKKI